MRDEVADVAQLGPDLLPGRVYSCLAADTIHKDIPFEYSSIGGEKVADSYAFEGDRQRRDHFHSHGSHGRRLKSNNKSGQAEITSLFRDDASTFLI